MEINRLALAAPALMTVALMGAACTGKHSPVIVQNEEETAPATLSYSGLAGNFVGLYEFYITVPASLANGDYQINVKQNGTAVPQTMYLTVHN